MLGSNRSAIFRRGCCFSDVASRNTSIWGTQAGQLKTNVESGHIKRTHPLLGARNYHIAPVWPKVIPRCRRRKRLTGVPHVRSISYCLN